MSIGRLKVIVGFGLMYEQCEYCGKSNPILTRDLSSIRSNEKWSGRPLMSCTRSVHVQIMGRAWRVLSPHPRMYLWLGLLGSKAIPNTSHRAIAVAILPVEVGWHSSRMGFRPGGAHPKSLTENNWDPWTVNHILLRCCWVSFTLWIIVSRVIRFHTKISSQLRLWPFRALRFGCHAPDLRRIRR